MLPSIFSHGFGLRKQSFRFFFRPQAAPRYAVEEMTELKTVVLHL
jgi:hypothetical protein